MVTYYYLDYLHREVFLEEEDIQTVPESGYADEACAVIADKMYVMQQFQADSFKVLKDAVCALCDSPQIRSRRDALQYIVWMVALNIKEERSTRHSEVEIKITRDDGFVWLVVSAKQARKLWQAGAFQLYRLYPDDSESAIESEEYLEESISQDYQIGVEVGFVATMGYAARMLR